MKTIHLYNRLRLDLPWLHYLWLILTNSVKNSFSDNPDPKWQLKALAMLRHSFSFRRLIPLFMQFIHFNWLFFKRKVLTSPKKFFNDLKDTGEMKREDLLTWCFMESQIGQLCKSWTATSIVTMNPTDDCVNEVKYCQWAQYSSSLQKRLATVKKKIKLIKNSPYLLPESR